MSACVSACIPSLVWLDLCVFVCVLGMRLLGGAVGEVLELLLVDLSDNGLVRGRQHGVLLGEILVEVIHISFGLLQTHAHENTHKGTDGGKDVRERSKLHDSDTF